MSMDLALAPAALGAVPNLARGISAAPAGAEAFAEIMAGVASTPGQPVEGIGTGANLRFNPAPAPATMEGIPADNLAAASPAAPAPAGAHLRFTPAPAPAMMEGMPADNLAEAGPAAPAPAGAHLRFDPAPALATREGMSAGDLTEAGPAAPAPARVTPTGGPNPVLETRLEKSRPRPAGGANGPIGAAVDDLSIDTASQADGTVSKMPAMAPVEDRPSIRRKRNADDMPTETAPADPAGAPVLVSIHAAPLPAAPEPAAMPPDAKGRGMPLARQRPANDETAPDRKPSAPVGSILSVLADQAGIAGEASMPAPGRTPPGTPAGDSRKGAEPVPASLTVVADIVQNLPPLIQSQVSAIVPAPSVAIGPATDVGATLSGEVIDMEIGGQWIDRVAREITALAQGSGHSRFQLNPPNLGRLQIDVWQGDGGGRVQLLTETDEAAMRLRQDQASLQADARLSALSLDRIVIDRATGGFGPSQDQGGQAGAGRHPTGNDTADRGASQSGNQPGSQAGQQAAAQHGHNGGSAGSQGKAAQRRDVLNEQVQPDGRDGRSSDRTDGRHVRYA